MPARGREIKNGVTMLVQNDPNLCPSIEIQGKVNDWNKKVLQGYYFSVWLIMKASAGGEEGTFQDGRMAQESKRLHAKAKCTWGERRIPSFPLE